MIKRVEKEFDNVYGMEIVKDYNFFDKPCIIIYPPVSERFPSYIYLSKIMKLMQIRSTKTDSNYTIDRLPFDILTGHYKENIAEIISKYIPVGDTIGVKRLLRNLNIISICKGNQDAGELIQQIHNSLEQANYSEEEIKEMMKEIFVLQIVDNYTMKNSPEPVYTPIPYTTTVVVHDIYDRINDSHVIDFNSDNPFASAMQIAGVRYVLLNSFGEGSLHAQNRPHRFEEDFVLAPITNSVIALYLIKAISASLTDSSKKEVSIYNEMQQIIKIAQDFIKSKNTKPEFLTRKEKEELNQLLYAEIKKLFANCIPYKELSDEEKKSLYEKDKAIELIEKCRLHEIFYRYNFCVDEIIRIITIFNEYQPGTIIDERYAGSSGDKIKITREDEIIARIKKLEEYYKNLCSKEQSINLPKEIPENLKMEFYKILKQKMKSIEDKIFSEEFQQIISEMSIDEVTLRKT